MESPDAARAEVDADLVLTEQLRLLHANSLASLSGASVLALLLAWGLSYSRPLGSLAVWTPLVWLEALAMIGISMRFMHVAGALREPRWHRGFAMLYFLFCGLTWGALPWMIFGQDNWLEIMLVMCTLAGICAAAMSYMSPVWPVFTCFAGGIILPTALRLFTLNDAALVLMALITLLFWAALTLQAAGTARAFRRNIELTAENEQARAAAEEANLAKSKFLAAASHDLRQPIHAQGMFLEALALSQLGAEEKKLLDRALAAGAATREMLNTLLDFSRIDAGVIAPQPRVFALQPLLHKLEVELAMQANAKGLVYRSRDSDAAVLSDPALVELILRNLVTNAIRYTENGGVLVGCRRRGEKLLVEVWDSGIGIAPEHQGEVFREFHQLGNAERDRAKGLGLGLAIAKGLATRLGETLTLASRPGRGSVFRLSLPLSREVPQAVAPTHTPDAAKLRGLRVLVIDDDQGVRTGMMSLLESWGCDCQAADSAAEALALADKRAPQLVISDYRLRERATGAEVIRALRERHGADLPALLITGDTGPDRLREAQASGLPLLHKPVPAETLHRQILDIF
ncbi:MAG: hybrid sensor histidine kinase/response regulator [Burkholderiales bacterium]